METPDSTIADLLVRIRQDDAAAFESLYLQMWEPLFVFAMKRLQSEPDAEDVVQNVFAAIWTRRHSLKVQTTFKGYLFVAVKYQVLDRINEMLQRPAGIETLSQDIMSEMDDVLNPMLVKELQAIVDKEIVLLPEKMRQIYLFNLEEHLSISEIAERLQLSEQTVRNQLNTARNRLKVSLRHALTLLFFC